MNWKTVYCLTIAVSLFTSCKKSFLDKKPLSTITAPNTIAELNGLLENQTIMNYTGGLPHISADEYNIVSDQQYYSLTTATERNGYIWDRNLYNGETVLDWEVPFSQIFYANSVLKVLEEKNFKDQKQSNRTKGWASFIRAYACYDLVKNFSPVYNSITAASDLGIPIKLSPDVDQVTQRSSLQSTFDHIFRDLEIAGRLLDAEVPERNKNRPSKAAVLALKARIYLYMGNYSMAEIAADSCLLYHNKLIDYNGISTTATTPFTWNTDEVIYQSTQVVNYYDLSGYGNVPKFQVNPNFIALYSDNDLRKVIFFSKTGVNKYNMKRGYVGGGSYPFTGLATDEVLIIKAECLARRGETALSMETLNQYLIKRYKKNLFTKLTASTTEEAIRLVLEERVKELIWRGLRWSDLKRFNRDGMNITLIRVINNITYSLPPNDSRYVFPIPDQEIALSGITQNQR
ncbi:RagB/SusD family nutrient uptake outer membrane protein [Pedobacter nyackensis]|uniref:SusD family protein n=1 Tax=Pedobacter nyackensis TaxID=475255 RepID=A0A1W2AJD1_9SPHI|nr:RagB/SusD family nutrient uptake outer membrane protein [Pedobacter nyackensis]SMC60358.1 SusD family protein [Pedobacter nyackensis]